MFAECTIQYGTKKKGGGGGWGDIYVFVDKQTLVGTSNLDTSNEVRVSWRFVPGEGQNRFSRSQLYWPSCSLEQNCFICFIRESPRQHS